jgi:molecular chaperone HtpG
VFDDVLVGERMVNSPASLVTTEYGWSANMQRIMKAQVLRDNQMSSFMVGKKKMEVNPTHPIMQELKNKRLGTFSRYCWLKFLS